MQKTNKTSETKLHTALAILSSGKVKIPPEELINIGDGGFLAISAEFLQYFVDITNLNPHESVLDLGCGIGRMAVGLRYYLDPHQGSYLGIDPVKSGIDWCKENFSDAANFRFEWIDIYNELYHPYGEILSTQCRLPAEDATIDLAILTSVFTHLYEREIAAYLGELRRLVKNDGRIFTTAYLYDGDAPHKSAVEHLKFGEFDSRYPYRWHVTGLPPLAAVCYSEAFLIDLFRSYIGHEPKVLKGRWRGGDGPWFQDLVLA